MIGLIVPFIGWLACAVLLWASTWWTSREKLLGTLVTPGGLALGLHYLARLAGLGADAAIRVAVVLAFVVAPFVVGALLMRRAVERACTA